MTCGCIHCGQAALFAHRGDPVCPDCSEEGYEGRPAAPSTAVAAMSAPSDQEKLWAEMVETMEGIVHFGDAVAYRDDALAVALRQWIARGEALITRARQPGAAA